MQHNVVVAADSMAVVVKEYSSEYSDSAFKVEDTIVSRR